MPSTPKHTLRGCLVLVLTASSARAQLQPEPGMRPNEVRIETVPETDESIVRELVELLDDDDWLQRDLATIELGELDPGITLEMIEALIERPGLSPEQLARLRLAALRRYAMRPKGALGVSFGTIRVGAIEIQPIPEDDDFPATKVLKDGDQIAMVADRIIDGSFSLRIEILSREPGDILPVTVLRGQRVLHLDLELGSFDDLSGAVRMDSDLLNSALALRWERARRGQSKAGSVGEAIELEDWERAAFPPGSTPDAREPDLHAPRGWVSGEGVRVETGNSGWSPSTIDVWSNPTALRDAATQRGMVLAGDRIQPMIALRLLIEREREQIIAELESIEGEERTLLIRRLDVLTSRLDALTEAIAQTRPTSVEP